jgi:tetratricopeptide (TPR) repeat protein
LLDITDFRLPDIGKLPDALSQNPEDAKLYVQRADLMLALGNYSSALSSYDAAIRLDPTLADAYAGRGYLGLFGGILKSRALEDFDKAINLDPKNADAYFGRVSLHAFQRLSMNPPKVDEDSVKEDRERALALDPTLEDYADSNNVRFVRIRAYRKPPEVAQDPAELKVDREQAKPQGRRQAVSPAQAARQQALMQQQKQFFLPGQPSIPANAQINANKAARDQARATVQAEMQRRAVEERNRQLYGPKSYYRGPHGEIVDQDHLPANALSRGYRYIGGDSRYGNTPQLRP